MHGSTPAPLPRIARIAVLGNLSREKGLNVVEACARHEDLALLGELVREQLGVIHEDDVVITLEDE